MKIQTIAVTLAARFSHDAIMGFVETQEFAAIEARKMTGNQNTWSFTACRYLPGEDLTEFLAALDELFPDNLTNEFVLKALHDIFPDRDNSIEDYISQVDDGNFEWSDDVYCNDMNLIAADFREWLDVQSK